MSMFNNTNKVNLRVLNNSIDQLNYLFNDLIEGVLPVNIIDQKIIDEAYINEIKKLLQMNDVVDVAKSINSLERKISKLESIINVDIDLPNLSHFYFSLSPVFLQMLIENDENFELGEFKLHCLDAVRIAIEEEMANWQDKKVFTNH